MNTIKKSQITLTNNFNCFTYFFIQFLFKNATILIVNETKELVNILKNHKKIDQ